MKKLMFVAALIGTVAAFGADADNFMAEDGIYNITITQKYLEPVYSKVIPGDPIVAEGYETKTEAAAAAKEEFALIKEDDPSAKITSQKTEKISDEGEVTWTCTIEWTYESEDESEWIIKSAKNKSVSVAGILVKGTYAGEFVEDGALFLWAKTKDNKDLVLQKYNAKSYDEAVIAGAAVGKKAVATICNDILMGVGFGTATDDMVKNASGNFTAIDEETVENSGFGTWKIAKDSTATKMAEKGNSLEQILNKKGATEVVDAE